MDKQFYLLALVNVINNEHILLQSIEFLDSRYSLNALARGGKYLDALARRVEYLDFQGCQLLSLVERNGRVIIWHFCVSTSHINYQIITRWHL